MVLETSGRAHRQVSALVQPRSRRCWQPCRLFRKFGYLFGQASGRAHNIQRALQNAAQLGRVGVRAGTEGRTLLQSHFNGVVNDPSNIASSFSNQYGSFVVRESLFAGPGGFVKLESTWQVMENGSFRLSTAIPFGGP